MHNDHVQTTLPLSTPLTTVTSPVGEIEEEEVFDLSLMPTKTELKKIKLTREVLKLWKSPPFQRPFGMNETVQSIAQEIKVTGVVPGVLTIGVFNNKQYRIDGQHRCEAFLLSEVDQATADVRYEWFTSMKAMGVEFDRLNSHIRRMGPDDHLRSLELSSKALQYIRKECPFIGYDRVRRSSSTSPIVGMSNTIRCWYGSESEVPQQAGMSATRIVRRLTVDDAEAMCSFAKIVESAWGRDPQYMSLWKGLNLTLCMWLYRRTVIHMPAPSANARATKISRENFKKCMMSVSAAHSYLDWLVGRNSTERDRAPAYNRLRAVIIKRIEQETGVKIKMPAPDWVAHR